MHNKNELEIWGKAQSEATRGRKSDWGDNLGAEILLLRTPTGNAIALAYTQHAQCSFWVGRH